MGSGAIFQNLTENEYDVFFDYDGLASGDFERVIFENISSRAHFLVLLTPSALERCGDPTDLFRREIESALASQRNIVPLMLEGFDFGTPAIANQLTGRLVTLKKYNALSITPEYSFEAMTKLRHRFLNLTLDAVLHPASPFAQQTAIEQKAAAETAPMVKHEELAAQQWFERGFIAMLPRIRCASMTRLSVSSRISPKPSCYGALRATPQAMWREC
jgi:TIR domain